MTADTPRDIAGPPTGRDKLGSGLLRNPMGLVSCVVLALILVVGVFAPWIVPFDPEATNLQRTNTPPGGAYLLGGDGSGRDILSRLIAATRVTVVASILATGTAMILGVSAGLLAGYLGGAVDATSSWVANMLMALPAIVVLIALYAVTGASTSISMIAFGVLVAPSFFRLVRTLVVGVKNELYVDAARVSGLSNLRILSRHVLYVVRAPIIIQASFVAGVAISMQAGLEFIGLGNQGQPSWGGMLKEAFDNLYVAPLQLVWPGLMLGITVSALVLLGNALRDELEGSRNVRQKRPTSVIPSSSDGDTSNALAVSSKHDNNVLLSLEDLKIAYPMSGGQSKEVVHGVTLRVHTGEVLGLVGETGSGKSQTAFTTLGLLPPDASMSGTVSFRGTRLVAQNEKQMAKMRGKVIGYVPQEPMNNLDPCFRVGQQLIYGLRAATGQSKAEAKTRLLKLLDRVGISDPQATFAAYPHEISGGMAQRVLIAGAVASKPELLIADEPTTALDVTVQAEILDLLRELQSERGMGVMLVTHNFGVVADLCDRVAVMQNGKLVETGSTSDVFADPKHDYTKMLLDSILDQDQLRTELRTGGKVST
ncbi:dipeptide/oligopeptide/nickel ABC transporter permease/ATP-binding protein [Arthrobacter castelli]|uniref:dipeptide/oligopeptide/nickel ABC transporter permease/ATP-binding protein n=1 Tax=Arthrobacter castelli TaxID=271431 RepID=UPI00068566D1|nr:dipeptide/oligopeptide/nickel ABC transporter permease/ATP-binding protein [Arthrobacter castelli]